MPLYGEANSNIMAFVPKMLSSLSAQVKSLLLSKGTPLLSPSITTCFSDSACSTPAVLDGPVAGVIDSSGYVGGEQIPDGFSASGWATNGAWSVTNNILTAASAGAYTTFHRNADNLSSALFRISIEVITLTSGALEFYTNNSGSKPLVAGINTFNMVLVANEHIYVRAALAGTSATLRNLSIKSLGIVATQTTSGYRPTLRKGTVTANVSDGIGNYWLDRSTDPVNCKLTTTAGAAFTSATVFKAIHGTGHATTLTAQNISGATNWTDNNLAALVLVPGSLTASEQSLVEKYLDTLA